MNDLAGLTALPTVDLIGPTKRADELEPGDQVVLRLWRQGVNRHVQRGRNGVRLGLRCTVTKVVPFEFNRLVRVEVEAGKPMVSFTAHEYETLHPDAVCGSELDGKVEAF